MYYVFGVNEDGVWVSQYTKEALQDRLRIESDEYDGEVEYGTAEDFVEDPWGWGENTRFIVRGEVIQPKPVERITKYEID